MTDQFQHVMVLTSIIIGLGITQILVGVGTMIERISGHGRPLRIIFAHAGWLSVLFVWMVPALVLACLCLRERFGCEAETCFFNFLPPGPAADQRR